MVDLQLHTTASDGLSDPPTFVRLARQAGLRIISVTNNDTVAAFDEVFRIVARDLAMARRLNVAVSGGSDFHGDARNTRIALGSATLPEAELEALEARAGRS